jgi:poly-beta-1,6-N-acetyl-D-glucosamine synthase
MSNLPRYVLITPVRNEAEFIEGTLKSVVAQSVLPMKWVIVSDGSTDGTDGIVMKYAADHPWIDFVRIPERRERHFAGKVQAFNAGYERIRHLPYEVLGSLDGDISFCTDYFAFLLQKLVDDTGLGLVGTPFQEDGKAAYDYRFVSIEHVSGACQVFRRECFEEIGGYTAIKGGGIDYIAVLSARLKGWKTRTYTEMACEHHRRMGTAQNAVLTARFKTGKKDYVLGSHPVWMLFRSARQMTRSPLLLGGLALLAGYCWAWLERLERPISAELIAFRRAEEIHRLQKFVGGPKVSGAASSSTRQA